MTHFDLTVPTWMVWLVGVLVVTRPALDVIGFVLDRVIKHLDKKLKHRCSVPVAARFGDFWTCNECRKGWQFGSYPGALPGGMWRSSADADGTGPL